MSGRRVALSVLVLCCLLGGCATPRLWHGVASASMVHVAPREVPARVAVVDGGARLVVAVAATDVADAATAGVVALQPPEGFADELAAVLAAPGDRTLTVLAFVDPQGTVVERRALLAVADPGDKQPRLAPLVQVAATAAAAAPPPDAGDFPCAVTWEQRRTDAAGASVFDVAWRLALTPGAVAVDAVVVAGVGVAYVVVFPIALVYGALGGDPAALYGLAALGSGF